MIKAKYKNDIYIIDEDLKVTGPDRNECDYISNVISIAKGDGPEKGFLVSNIAQELSHWFEIIEVVDKEMEESKPNTIY
ncbi:hypothetical protein IKU74_08725 [bacterium]|nr:hypothetical protein [bacterium]